MKKIVAIVAGSRDFMDYNMAKSNLLKLLKPEENDVTIISGCAKGADYLGMLFAEEYHCKLIQQPARWDKHGKAAGPIRNKQMLDIALGLMNESGAEPMLIAFWDGKSRGTKNMIDIAQKSCKVKVEVIYYNM